jgi:Ca-activated chloride channel homolog
MQVTNKMAASILAAFVAIVSISLVSFSAPGKNGQPRPQTALSDTGGVEIPAGASIGYQMWSNSPYFVNQPDSSIFLYLEAKAIQHTAPAGKRLPLNIALVLDRSGSMSGEKLAYCKKAAQFVVDNLDASDRVSIVIYESGVRVLLPATQVANKEQIKRMIDGVQVAGGTCMSCGMLSGYDEVKKFFQQQHVNRVLLLTDGLANEGISAPRQLDSIASERANKDRITLSTFGVGADFDEKMLTDLAEYGIGNYYFIDKPENIPPIFNKELKGLLEVVAQDASITLQLPNGVSLVKVYGYKYEQKGNTIVIPFRDVFSEEMKSVLVEVKLTTPAISPLTFTSTFAFSDAAKNQKGLQLPSTVTLQPTIDYAMVDNSYDDYVLQQVTIFKSNDLLEAAMDKADKGDFRGADSIVTLNAGYLNVQGAKVKTVTKAFSTQASLNTNYRAKLAEAKNMDTQSFKLYQKTNRSENYKGKKRKS